MPKVFIFTLNGCIHCSSLKNRLDRISIPYIDLEITDNKDLWDEVVKQIKHEFLPTTFITPEGSDTGDIYIPSIDYETEDEIVDIISIYFFK